MSSLSLDGSRESAILDIGIAVARLHLLAEQQSQVFQMLASDRFGEQFGGTVLVFRVIDRDPSAFRHFLHKEEPQHDALHVAEILGEDRTAGDLAVCVISSSVVAAQLFQKVFVERGFDEARSDCVEFIVARTHRCGRAQEEITASLKASRPPLHERRES